MPIKNLYGEAHVDVKHQYSESSCPRVMSLEDDFCFSPTIPLASDAGLLDVQKNVH
jgi:hypothetical protein